MFFPFCHVFPWRCFQREERLVLLEELRLLDDVFRLAEAFLLVLVVRLLVFRFDEVRLDL